MEMNFKKKYLAEVVPLLKEKLGASGAMSIPKVEKIVVNVGMGSWLQGGKDFSKIEEGLLRVTGQKPVLKKSRISVSNFKLRQGMPVGLTVTLRGENMYEFLAKIIHLYAPRIRDFSGFSARSFDGRGNYSFGVKEYGVFPEIHYEDVVKPYGLQITVCTTAQDDAGARALLDGFGFPFTRS